MNAYEDLATRFFDELVAMRNEFGFLTKWRETGAKSTWTCKDGHTVRICDMDDGHLDNTIRMLQRKAPNSEALKYMRIEKRYRTNYNSLKSQIAHYEKIADTVF